MAVTITNNETKKAYRSTEETVLASRVRITPIQQSSKSIDTYKTNSGTRNLQRQYQQYVQDTKNSSQYIEPVDTSKVYHETVKGAQEAKAKTTANIRALGGYDQTSTQKRADSQQEYLDYVSKLSDLGLAGSKIDVAMKASSSAKRQNAYDYAKEDNPLLMTDSERKKYIADYEQAQKELEELLGIDLEAYRKDLDAAERKANQSRTGGTTNIHAFGGYDETYMTPEEREYADKLRTYNLAEQAQKGAEMQKLYDENQDYYEFVKQRRENGGTLSANAQSVYDYQTRQMLYDRGYTDEDIYALQDAQRWVKESQRYDEAYQKARELAITNPTAASVLSVPANLLGGVTGTLDLAFQKASGRDVMNVKGQDMRPYAFTKGVRNTVSENLAKTTDKEFMGQNLKAFLYETGMSMADSAAIYAMTIAGIPANIGTALLSGSAALDATVQAKERGVSDAQALMTGLTAGLAEFVFERVSLEALLKSPNLNNLTTRQQLNKVILNSFKQAGVEGSEEVFTDMANRITDAIINGNLSEYNASVQAYIEGGMTPADAKYQAELDFIQQIAASFAAGAISGGVMGGASPIVTTAVNNVETNRSYRDVYGSSAAELAQEAQEIGNTSKTAQRVARKVAEGKEAGGADLQRLVYENQEIIKNMPVDETVDETESTAPVTADEYAELIRAAKEQAQEEAQAPSAGNLTTRQENAATGQETANTETLNRTEIPNSSTDNSLKALETVTERNGLEAVAENATTTQPQENNAQNMRMEATEKSLTTGDKSATLDEAAKQYGKQSGAFKHIYHTGQNIDLYDSAFKMAYEYGKAGVPYDAVKDKKVLSYLTEAQRENAYEAGVAASKNNQREEMNNGITEEGLRVREGSQRTGSENSGGTVRGLEEGTGRNPQEWVQAYRGGQESGGGAAFTYGQKVNTYIPADTGNARAVTGGETKETREAKRLAEERGLELYLFGGDNLHLSDGNDSIDARAMIVGKNALVRVDHPDYTADQLMRHEIGHDMIDSGEVDPNSVRKRLKDTYTDKELDRISEMYIEAYKGAKYTAEEAWVEMICDSLGDMNVFAGEDVRGKIFSDFMENTRSAVEAERSSTRAPPAVQEAAEETTAPAEVKTTTSENGYTVTDNPEYGTIDVQFSEKPGEEIRDVLKNMKFRWNGKRKVWYGSATHEEITEALDEAYAAEKREAEGEREITSSTYARAAARTKANVDDFLGVKPEQQTKAPAKKRSKPRTVESTERLEDFGEKIGGARKDWRTNGLNIDDLSDMNDRERKANVKKDNVWKRPDYKKLIEGGADRGILFGVNEIRKSLPASIAYGYKWTEEVSEAKQREYISTIRAIQEVSGQAKEKNDFAKVISWLMDNGYLEIAESYGRKNFKSTNKYRDNPALSGSTIVSTIGKLTSSSFDLVKAADKANFAVDATNKIPAGYAIHQGSVRTDKGDKETDWYITKGSFIIKEGFPTYESAMDFLRNVKKSKDKKTRFVPPQLLGVHRKGPDYRGGQNVDGQAYIDRFGFKGGEFGNWMNAKDRQVSMNYGYDALMDLADALNVDYNDISFGGNLNIAFGARGQGLSGAAAHYENMRHVINLTKMNGAGSLAHEWFHALDDFVGGYTENYATNRYYKLPEKTKTAIRDLITTMQYKDGTQEETDLAAQKRAEQTERNIRYMLSSNFRWVERVENGTFDPATDGRYFKTQPTAQDAEEYRRLEKSLVENFDLKAVDALSDLRKKITGHVIEKGTRDEIALRADLAKRAGAAKAQPVRKMTDYYKDSREFGNLHAKDGDYWDSTIEMAARAFATYITDKTSKQNDYLSGHSDSVATITEDSNGNLKPIYAYPRGEERVAINAAFDQLISALKDDGYLHEQEESERPETIRYSREVYAEENATARMTTARIDAAIADSGAGNRTDYAQSWITSINPSDFLKLTLSERAQNRKVFDSMPGDYDSTVNDRDFTEDLKNSRQTPYLSVDVNTGEVVGHEGRHRMRSLEKRGITSAEILIRFSDDGYLVKEKNGYRNPLETIGSFTAYNQRGTGQSVDLQNIIPLNKSTRNEVLAAYGENAGGVAIRFSREAARSDIAKENDALKKQLKTTTERLSYWKGQTRLTTEKRVQAADVAKQARNIISAWNSTFDEKTATTKMNELADAMWNGDGTHWQEVKDRAVDIARDIVSNSRELMNEEAMNTRNEVVSYLRGVNIDINSAKGGINGWSEFYRHNFGRMNLRNGGTGIDVLYPEMTQRFGEAYFPSEIINPSDQLQHISDFLDETAAVYENPYDMDAAVAIESCANEIIDRLLSEEVRLMEPTFADKAKVREQNAYTAGEIEQGRRMVKEMRLMEERSNARLERSKAALAKVRENRDAKIAQLKDENRQQRKKQIESRKARTLRESIGRTANDFRQMLLHPTDSRYAPFGLMDACIDVAMMLDTSGPKEGTRAKAKFNSVMEALSTMKDRYDELKVNQDYEYQSEYDEDFAYMVDQLRKHIGQKSVRDLSLDELQDIHNILHDIKNMLQEAKFQIGKAEKVTNYSVGESIIRQMKSVKPRTKAEAASDFAARNTASALRNVRRMSGYDDNAALAKLFYDLNEGVKKKNRFMMESERLFDEFVGDRFAKAAADVRTYDTGKREMQMTEMEAIQLVLTWEREMTGKTNHLARGGAVIPDHALLKKGKYADAFAKGTVYDNIEQDEILAIERTFDDWAQKYKAAAKSFFNGKAKDAINETTLKTKHRAVAVTENYIPVESDSNYIAKELEGVKFDATIEGMGMLKSVVEGASNPIVIRGLNTVIENHIERVGQLYGLAIPVRNFNKAYNIREVGTGTTPKKSLALAWSTSDQKLVEQAITDLQTNRARANDDFSKIFRKAQSKFVEATLLSNISVTIKQAASYSTAGLYLSQKALFPYQATIARLFANDNSKFAKNLYAEIDAHTAEHYIRRKGMSMQEISTIAQDKSKLVRAMDENLPDALNPLKWIQNMDVATTGALWLACKKQVEIDGVNESDSEYWGKVTKLYEQVIEETQPMYDSLHRPELQKSTNELLRSILMFRTQPLQNSGILYDAAGELNHAKKAKDKKAIQAASKKMRAAVGSQLASLAVFASMSLLAYAVRNRMGRYRDDEDELTVLSIMKRVLGDMGGNALQLILPVGGSKLAGFAEKRLTGSYYGGEISVPVLDKLNDYRSDFESTWEAIADGEKVGENLFQLSLDVAGMFGAPAENIYNIFRGVIGNVTDMIGKPVDWATDIPDPNLEAVKNAFDNGHDDTAKKKLDEYIQMKIDDGKTEKEAKSGAKSSMTSWLKPRYRDAYAKMDDKETYRIRRIMKNTGLYGSADDIIKTCQKWLED